jgi:hypothetical protein
MNAHTALYQIAKPYGVVGISFGGCIKGKAKGLRGSFRRKAHAHCYPQKKGYKFPFYGWICFLSSKPEKRAIQKNGNPTHLFWHEIAHMRRRSWTEAQCDKWAWKMVRSFKSPYPFVNLDF